MKLTGVVDMLRRKLLVVGVSAVVGVVLLLPATPGWLWTVTFIVAFVGVLYRLSGYVRISGAHTVPRDEAGKFRERVDAMEIYLRSRK